MNNRISELVERKEGDDGRPQPIGEILAELLLQYQVRFPEARIAVLETPVDVI